MRVQHATHETAWHTTVRSSHLGLCCIRCPGEPFAWHARYNMRVVFTSDDFEAELAGEMTDSEHDQSPMFHEF
jgi:hypothetical protein